MMSKFMAHIAFFGAAAGLKKREAAEQLVVVAVIRHFVLTILGFALPNHVNEMKITAEIKTIGGYF